MKRCHSQAEDCARATYRWLLVPLWLALGCGLSPAQKPITSSDPPQPLPVADSSHRSDARIVVHNQYLGCFDDSTLDADVVLSTVGSEYLESGQPRFLPVLSVAYERDSQEGAGLEWMALWNLGKERTGFWRNLRATLPFNQGHRSAEASPQSARLLTKLHTGQVSGEELEAPKADVDAVGLWKASYAGLVASSLGKALGWGGVYNPVQFFYRTLDFRRRDLRDRRFQQTYQGLLWYADAVDSTELQPPRDALAAIKFHLIRNRSTFGPWASEEQFLESAWSYDGARRQRTISVSATLMSAANEYGLGYEEFHQPVVNGTPTPVGGVLYYDPAVEPAADLARWDSPNLFDLRYNPFTDPRVQEAAKQHPGERIPLALYSYYAVLPRKPILLADFFDPKNARGREAAAVRMNLLRESLQVGGLGLAYWGLYQPVSYVANKKGYTPLANMIPAMGVEEFRLMLRSRLLFEPELADVLLQEVDKRELNPLMASGATERANAQLHYELLSRKGGAETCRQVGQIRRHLYRELSGQETEKLGPQQKAALHMWLEQQRALHKLSRLMDSDWVWEQLRQESEPALATLEAGPLAPRLPARKVLLRFKRRLLEESAGMRPTATSDLSTVQQRVDELLARAYELEGKSRPQLEADLRTLQQRLEADRLRQQALEAVGQMKQFEAQLQDSLDWLGRLESNNDLRLVPAWRVERALEFLTQASRVANRNTGLKPVLARYQERIHRALAQAEAKLSQHAYAEEEVETVRMRCLAMLKRVESPDTAVGAGG